jgi:uncharacterized protein (TIGR02452 family)
MPAISSDALQPDAEKPVDRWSEPTEGTRSSNPTIRSDVKLGFSNFRDGNDYQTLKTTSSLDREDNEQRSRVTTTNPKEPFDHNSSTIDNSDPPSSTVTKDDDPIVVYVLDLPVNIENPRTLEDMIRQCLEERHRQKVRDVKCDTKLGIGTISLDQDEDKRYLTQKIQKILIEPSNNTTVSIVDQLELVSYVVIQSTEAKDLPTVDDLSRRWMQVYRTKSPPKCELLSVQFPNIFQLTTYSLDELMRALSTTEFSVNNQFAMVYFRADCSFLENLPRSTNVDRLKDAISQQITDRYTFKELMHIQYNKNAANAVVLTSGRARIWSLHQSLTLDGRQIPKKDGLACRLSISKIPPTIPTSLIEDHKIFAKTVVNISRSNDHAIVELSDPGVYEKCIDQGAFRIGDALLAMGVYSSTSNPEDGDIDAETWYETEMRDYKPDIMRFMADPQHPIFRYKWNWQAFLKQFSRWSSNDRHADEKQCNLQRHLLRMTVMLNTIGVVKRGFYRVGEKEMKIKSDRLKTILYGHQAKLQYGRTIPLSQAANLPYPRTSVRVVNEDCLIVYKKLVSNGHRPVILNMANAHTPGGGYRRGDGAQEETLFRRSNYYQSLDRELDDGKPSARFVCGSSCDLVPLTERDSLYPMDHFGAIYTSGLTVFRQPEETGYAFMDIPMYDVCAIAMAAYRDPHLDKNNLLTPKYSIGTRKKIENIFVIAHQHKHDCLVLSALGCGAFRNPPSHVATIFKSVIDQYAGYFQQIHFAIIDDHNAGHDLNPTGNYRPFQSMLDNYTAAPRKHLILDMMIGPWQILHQTTGEEIALSDVKICHLKPCHHGGKCSDLKDEPHCREFTHPPLCPWASSATPCKEKTNDQHSLWFRHRLPCADGGECKLLESDSKHASEFEHPEFCRDGGACENLDQHHLKAYRHVPLCRHRRQCVEYNSRPNEHCKNYRHCIPKCRFGHFCVRFHDEEHLQHESHPFKSACPFTPFHCRDYNVLSQAKDIQSLPIAVRNHCLCYSHVCRFGRQCFETSDVHWQNTIHVARHLCAHGDRCTKLHQEEHLNAYSHPGIADIRRLCHHQGWECRDQRKGQHIRQYRHDGNHDQSGVINCFGQNRRIHFVDNQEHMIKAIEHYAKQPLSVSTEVRKLVRSLQPVHRCSKAIFESILVHGHVMSREHMERLKKPAFAAQTVQEHKRVRAIFDRYKMSTIELHAKEYIRGIVSEEYSKRYTALPAAEAMFSGSSTLGAPDEYTEIIRKEERFLRSMIKPEEIDTIRKRAIAIAEASWSLHHSPTGIKYEPDKLLGTDKHVFSILGPHLGHYYGDIILVFKSQVMLHPDANFSPQAATSFASGRTFTHRPWVTDPGNDVERVKCFHQSKLHCSIPGYDYAAAAELTAMTGLAKKTMDVIVEDILKRWTHVDSHEVFEAHLPQLVPLDYIEAVYIPKNLFATLTPAAQESARKTFRVALHITEHSIALTDASGGSVHALDSSRSKYQKFVNEQLIEQIQKRMEHSRHSQGTVITLAPSQFTDHIVLPMTIDKAYDQYRRSHQRDRHSEDVYIYWQAMYGDMMITLSNESIDPNTSQPHIRCLVCYIGERPSTATTVYHESSSYINAKEPYRHDVIMINGQCSSSSRSFYRGCNMEDFLTFCMKLEKKTGQVTLFHAGPSGIYCQQTIAYKFPKATLDLNKLRFIQVSAGTHKVPIRNLIIAFEPIPDLHPSLDKNFKPGNNVQPRRRERPPSPTSAHAPREKSPSILEKVINAVGSFLGFGDDDKKLPPCQYSSNCLLQESPKHMKEYSHPGPNNDKELHLTYEPRRMEQSKDRNRTSEDRMKYAHGKDVQINRSSSPSHYQDNVASNVRKNEQSPSCRHGSECRHQADPDHCSKYSHPGPSARSTDDLIPCRHGSECRNKNDTQHCLKYSHPYGDDTASSVTPCRHGRFCRDQNDPRHCSRYSHPSADRTTCRYGQDCRDKHDPRHVAKYAHPSIASHDRTPCRHGRDCHDKNDMRHCAKYSHPNK